MGVSGDKVRLGIQAPPDVLVLRDELETFTAAIPASALPAVAMDAARAVA